MCYAVPCRAVELSNNIIDSNTGVLNVFKVTFMTKQNIKISVVYYYFNKYVIIIVYYKSKNHKVLYATRFKLFTNKHTAPTLAVTTTPSTPTPFIVTLLDLINGSARVLDE